MDSSVEESTLYLEAAIHKQDVTDSAPVRVNVGQESVL